MKGAAVLAALLSAPLSVAADTPAEPPAPSATSQVPAHPQRPSLGSTAATTVAGYVELEAGGVFEDDGFSTPVRFRFGLGRIAEAYLGLSPIVGVDEGEGTETGFGDTVLGAKIRFFESPDGDAAVEAFVKLPTADEDKGLGTGDTDAGFRFIASRAWGKNQFHFNLGGDFAGVPDATSNDARWTLSLMWARTFESRLGMYGELFIQFLPAADDENISNQWGVTYTLNPSMVLDAGVNIGLSDDAPDVQVRMGITKVLGKLFQPGPGGKRAATPGPAS